MRFRSIRARLTAVTLLAFAVVVGVLALVAVVAARDAMRRSIDADLRRRGRDFADEVVHWPGGGPPSHRGDDGPPFDGGEGPPRERVPRRANPDWIAPALVTLGREKEGDGPNSLPYDLVGYAEAARGRENFTTAFVQGEPRRVFSTPVVKDGRIGRVVQVAFAMRPALESLDDLRRTLLLAVVPLGLLLSGLASLFVVDRFLRPLRHLDAEAIRIGQGASGERLTPLGEDEFAHLAGTLNGMIARLEAASERSRRFTDDASHELKTPLSVLKTYLGVLKRSHRPVAEETEALGAMERSTDRMAALVGDLLTLARFDAGAGESRRRLRLDEVLREAVGAVPGAETRVRLQAGETWVDGSPDELARLFANLVDNALRHSGIDVDVDVDLTAEGRFAVVRVRDHGVGIDAADLPHLFERFYRADRARASKGGGSGLGLAIVQSIVQTHGGAVEVDSPSGGGATFTVRLPQAL